jgi:hypothetical protein
MENIASKENQLTPTSIRKKDESEEKIIKEVGSSSNDETNDNESTEKSKR